jgi:hypothetical protein
MKSILIPIDLHSQVSILIAIGLHSQVYPCNHLCPDLKFFFKTRFPERPKMLVQYWAPDSEQISEMRWDESGINCSVIELPTPPAASLA